MTEKSQGKKCQAKFVNFKLNLNFQYPSLHCPISLIASQPRFCIGVWNTFRELFRHNFHHLMINIFFTFFLGTHIINTKTNFQIMTDFCNDNTSVSVLAFHPWCFTLKFHPNPRSFHGTNSKFHSNILFRFTFGISHIAFHFSRFTLKIHPQT